MGVDDAFWFAGGAGGVKPETIILGPRGNRPQLWRSVTRPRRQCVLAALHAEHNSRPPRACTKGAFDLTRELGRVHETGTLGILDEEREVVGPKQCVQRNGNNACLNSAPKQEKELGTIVDHHQDPLTAPDAEGGKGVAEPVDVVEQFGVSHPPLECPHGYFAAAPFGEVTIDEVFGRIERLGKPQLWDTFVAEFLR